MLLAFALVLALVGVAAASFFLGMLWAVGLTVEVSDSMRGSEVQAHQFAETIENPRKRHRFLIGWYTKRMRQHDLMNYRAWLVAYNALMPAKTSGTPERKLTW